MFCGRSACWRRYGMTRHHPVLKKASFALIERQIDRDRRAQCTSRVETEQAEAEALGLKCKACIDPSRHRSRRRREASDRAGKSRATALSCCSCRASTARRTLKACFKPCSLVMSKNRDVTLNIAGDGDPKYIRLAPSARARSCDRRPCQLARLCGRRSERRDAPGGGLCFCAAIILGKLWHRGRGSLGGWASMPCVAGRGDI